MIDLVIIGSVAAVSQLAAHWFPWRRLFKKELPRVLAYIIGTACMMTPVIVYMTLKGMFESLTILITAVIFSGTAVMAGYAVDGLLERLNIQELQVEDTF